MNFLKKLKSANKRKKSALIISSILIVTVAIGGTIAWLTANASHSQSFSSSKVSCDVIETLDGDKKKDVYVKNTGEIDAYIRVAIVPSWVDPNGNTVAQEVVESSDYTNDWNSTDWFLGSDGYYYCKTKISANSVTPKLINSYEVINKTSGYKLKLDVVASAIQAAPSSAVEDAWAAVNVDANGNLTK